MRTFITCLLALIPVLLRSQTLTPEDALAKFAKYPQERIFIQFNKTEYLAGETVHFKAYVFCKYQLSPISTNFYFEFVDHDKQVVYKNVFPISGGVTVGAFKIPNTLRENVSYFRAYTAWMLNFDEKFQFLQPVNIYNPSSPTKLVAKPVSYTATIHPEGGTFLDNVATKAVVRIKPTGALPSSIKGYVFDNADTSTKLATITFLNEEIGSFTFIPTTGKQYSVRLTDEFNNTKIVPIPASGKQGVALKTKNAPGAIDCELISKGVTGNLKDYKILAHCGGKVLYSNVIKSNNEQEVSRINIDSATKGLVHITVFDPQGNVAAERLSFANAAISQVTPAVRFNKTANAKRGLNEWELDVDTIKPYTYSVEIIESQSSSVSAGTPNLVTAFWLQDLAATTYSSLYFNNLDPASSEAVDLLLISETWNRFTWKTFLDNPVPKFKYPLDNFLTYEGQAVENKKPVANENLSLTLLQSRDSSKSAITLRTNDLGYFRIYNIVCFDTVKIFYKINNLKKERIPIDITFKPVQYFTPYIGELPFHPFAATERKLIDTVPARVKEWATALNIFEPEEAGFKKLEEVIVKTKSKNLTEELSKRISGPMFYDPSQILFDFVNQDQDIGSDVLSWLAEKSVGAFMEGSDLIMRGVPMSFYLDERPVEASQLYSLPMAEIALVKVIKNSITLGTSAPVLAVYTRRAGNIEDAPGYSTLRSSKIAGYPIIERFKTVEYSQETFKQIKEDTRSVLYWNTYLNPVNAKETIRFYNNDISKKVRLIVTGFQKDGTPVYLNKIISL